ncbi:glycosyltransferase [Vibrio sp. PP-XX7]
MLTSNKITSVAVVIPVFNEEQSLPELLRRTDQACRLMDRPYEIILIDDGSSDRSGRTHRTGRQSAR